MTIFYGFLIIITVCCDYMDNCALGTRKEKIKKMTLLEGQKGNFYRVVQVRERESVQRRLEALGILEGTKLEILNHKKNGSTIIKVRGTRWAMGRKITGGIEVEECSDE